MNRRRHRGFTLIEVAVVVAIALVIAALAIVSIARQRPRASLATTTAELRSLVHQARQRALTSGHDVVVLFFPRYASSSGTGRVIVYEDGNYDFFTTGAAGGSDFESFTPASPRVGSASRVVTIYDLPRGIAFGVSPGAAATLPAPLDGIDVSGDCSFCGTLTDHRGAIRFDGRGRADFHDRNGVAPSARGGAVNVTSTDDARLGQRTLVVTPAAGAVQVISHG